MNSQENNPQNHHHPKTVRKSFGQWLRTSLTARMLTVGILILVLLIPLSYIQNLIYERSMRQQDVVREINQKWGNQVLLYGPIVKIPYKTHTINKTWDDKSKVYIEKDIVSMHHAYFFPKTLDIKAHANSKTLGRSIYESVVYSSDISLNGNFELPDFTTADIPEEDILWEKATLIVKSSNTKGIQNNLKISFGSSDYPLQSKFSQDQRLHTLETAFLDQTHFTNKSSLAFELNMKINGSEQMRFIPVGKETNVLMTSNWGSPSFDGNFLPDPDTKEISDSGFKAKWKVLDINRAFQQEFFGALPNLINEAFGVRLVIPVDEYQQSERTAKYGYLVIALTFLIFFLIQTASKITIHPFQYLMIGLALTMFYTLLVSIAEHSGYHIAYLIAGSAVVSLITIYAKSILKSTKFILLIFSSLTILYGFIFVLIQIESYALLVGSIGLFLILGTVMLVSRKIDWNND